MQGLDKVGNEEQWKNVQGGGGKQGRWGKESLTRGKRMKGK